jgi:hypothetical protein
LGNNQIRVLCRAPVAHGGGQNPHDTAFAVRILPRAHDKGRTTHFCSAKTLPCAVGKGNTRHRSLSCATCEHGKEKGLTTVPDETASPALCRAPPTNTHDTKKEKKASRVGACLLQATTTPSLAAGPPFPTPATAPPAHTSRSARSAAASPWQLHQELGRQELGSPRE